MKKGLSLLLAFLLVWVVAIPAFAAENPFADVAADHWAYDSVARLAAAGLIIGYPDGEFKGNRNFTRYEMAMVFARMLGRIENYITTGIDARVDGISDEISSDVYTRLAAEMASELAKEKDKLTKYIEAAVEKKAEELPEKVVERVVVEKPAERVVERVVEKPVREVVEKVVVEKPVHTTVQKTVEMPFELTEEAKAILADFVADQVAKRVAEVKPQTIEKVVETKIVEKDPEITREEIDEIIAIATAAEALAKSNEGKLLTLDEAVKAAEQLLYDLEQNLKQVADEANRNFGEMIANSAAIAGNESEIQENAEAIETNAKNIASNYEDITANSTAIAGNAEDIAANAREIAANREDIEELASALGVNKRAIGSTAEEMEILVAALEADIDALADKLEEKTSALEDDIAKLADEFETELAVLGVRVSELEYVFEKLEDRVAKLEEAQQATAEELAAFKAEHEKVKITGSTSTTFDATAVETDNYDGKAWKDPRNHDFDGDGTTGDAGDYYVDNAELKQTLELDLTATPAEGVKVTANLAANTDFFGKDDSFNLSLSDLSLSVTTDGVLKSFYAGNKADENITSRFHSLIFADAVVTDEEVVALNLVNGNLDTEITLFQESYINDGGTPDDPSDDVVEDGIFVTAIDQEYKVSDNLTLNGEAVLYWSNADLAGSNHVGRRSALLASASGTTLGLDYDFDLATSDFGGQGTGAWVLDLSKSLDFASLGFKYAATGPNYDAPFGSYTAGQTRMDLTAGDISLFGASLSGAYVTISDSSDFSAWRLNASKDVEFGLPLTVSGQLASDGTESNQKLTVALTDYALTDALTVSADFGLENDVIASGDWDDAADWTDKDSRSFGVSGTFAVTDGFSLTGGYDWTNERADDAAAFASHTVTTVGADYTLTVAGADVTAGYEWKKRNGAGAWGSAQNIYSLEVVTPFFGATLTTEGKLATGWNAEYDKETTDKVASFELAYPVVEDVDLTVGGTYVNSVDNAGDGYTVKKLNGGVSFSF